MKPIRLIIALVLLIAIASTSLSASAQTSLPPICSGVQLQNKGSSTADPVTLSFYHQGDNDSVSEYDYPVPGGIGSNVSKSFYIPSLLPGTVPSGAYSVIVNSTEELNSLVNQIDCDLVSPRVGSSHSGFEQGDIGNTIYLAFVLSRAYAAGWSSAIAIQNASLSQGLADVTIEFYRSGESTPAETFNFIDLKYGETWYLDLSTGTYATAALDGFSGTAKITSDQEVAAVANYAPGDGSRMLSYNGTGRDSQKIYATQVMKHYTGDDYTAGITLYNPNSSSTPIRMKFYQSEATSPLCTIDDSILANSAYVKYLGSISSCTTGSLPNGFNGYLSVEVLSGTNKILGIFNFDSAAGQSGAANMATLEEASTVVYFPQIVRSYSGFESGWQIVNTSGNQLDLNVDYYKTTGELTASIPMTVLPNASKTVYVGAANHSALGTNWNGGATITVVGGTGTIVGQANFISLGVVETLLIYNGFAP